MASSSRTNHYMLNQWAGSDKPTRSDFVRDNALIDTAIWQHVSDAYAHLSNFEKTRVSDPYVTTVVQGTGESSRTITFDFTPKLVIVFAADEPIVKYENGESVVNACAAVTAVGSTGGCAMSSGGLILYSSADGGVRYDLNNIDKQYIVTAFR